MNDRNEDTHNTTEQIKSIAIETAIKHLLSIPASQAVTAGTTFVAIVVLLIIGRTYLHKALQTISDQMDGTYKNRI